MSLRPVNTKFLLSLLLLVACTFGAHAQNDQERGGISFGILTSTSLSYVGWRQNLSGEINIKGHRIYAGPGMSISDAYTPWSTNYGFQLGYRYIFDLDHNWLSSAGLHTQTTFGKQGFSDRYNQTAELLLSYGFGYNFGKFYALNTIGFGGYLERFYNHAFREYNTQDGYSFQIMLSLGYEF